MLNTLSPILWIDPGRSFFATRGENADASQRQGSETNQGGETARGSPQGRENREVSGVGGNDSRPGAGRSPAAKDLNLHATSAIPRIPDGQEIATRGNRSASPR